ncbi:MAG TPA: AAA family ATPase, partial [Thermoplasmata archaeon]|nr:AAA family ATPase [Thermoplasmata archaeon]
MSGKDRVEKVLRVEEAKSRDAGRGIARIDAKIAKEMGMVPGDIVMVEGKKKTACIYWPGYSEDDGKDIIRIDGVTRRNAGAGIDDKVKVRKAQVKKASRIVFSPTEELRIVGIEEYLSHIMNGRVATKGDRITLNIMGRKIDLIITSVSPPSEAVIIDPSTEIKMSEKIAKEEMKIPRITYEDIGGLE